MAALQEMMMSSSLVTERLYILRNGEVVRFAGSFIQWALAREDQRPLFVDEIEGVGVSTVFLGMDHNFSCKGPPLVFETMIFGGPNDLYQRRCSTYDEAEKQHIEAVNLVRRDHGRDRANG